MATFKWEVKPCKEIGPFVFGESRTSILTAEKNRSFLLIKKKVKPNMDQYRDFHAYYTETEHLNALEIFGNIHVIMNGTTIFPENIETILSYMPDLQRVSDSYISKDKSLGFFVPNDDGIIESVLIAEEHYYDFIKK